MINVIFNFGIIIVNTQSNSNKNQIMEAKNGKEELYEQFQENACLGADPGIDAYQCITIVGGETWRL